MPHRAAPALLLAALLLVLPALPAAAHAVLVSSTPAAGAVLDAVPDEIVLEFNEPVEAEFGQLQVSGPDGERLDQEPPRASGSTVTAPISPATTAGEHTVAYRIISADGHPVEGQLTYEVSEAAIDVEGAGSGDEGPGDGQDDVTSDDPVTTDPQATDADDADGDAEIAEPEPAPTLPAADDDEGGAGLLPVAALVVIVLAVAGIILARRGEDEDVAAPADPADPATPPGD